jgi:ribulose-phosphate 3-epimerase
MAKNYVDAGCQRLILHAEACPHLHRSLDHVRSLGATAGVAINPHTPAAEVENILDLVDLILVMTVNPGFGGQKYIASMEPKIAQVRAMINQRGLSESIDLEVDGGISATTVAAATRAGANTFVAGSALFRHEGGLKAAVSEIRANATAARAA